MKYDVKALFADKVQGFRLPRYRELPNMGLYLEQVTKYINGLILPLGCPEITSSMVSNYVKKGVIAPPVKKQYDAEQIAYLIAISFIKSVLSLENITQLFTMQKETYGSETAFNYFCSELENMLAYTSGLKDTVDEIGASNTEVKSMLRSTMMAVSHILFIANCFSVLNETETEKPMQP
ncbi:MAG: DUF1836 domain-containing protein [Clostridia bacterium]|nr:DUF1836 domain-containing protein [Clostridia bacterium]